MKNAGFYNLDSVILREYSEQGIKERGLRSTFFFFLIILTIEYDRRRKIKIFIN